MARLATKVGIVSASKIISSITFVAGTAVLARKLDPLSYGTFQQAWLVLTVGTTILLSGIPLAVFAFAPRADTAGRKGLLRFVLLVLAGLGVAGALLLLGGAGALGALFRNPALPAHLRVLALYVVLILPANPLESFLIAENRHAHLARITVAASAVFLAAVALPAGLGAGASPIYPLLAVYALVRSGLLMRAAFAPYRGVTAALAPGTAGRFLAYVLPLGANEIVRVSSGWLDKTLVAARFDPQTFAVYANGAFEIPLVSILLASVTSVLLPEFSRLGKGGDQGPILALWSRSMRRTALLLFPLCAFALLYGREIMTVLFSARYAASAGPFRIYLLLLPLRAAAYTPILLALGRSRTVLWGALADLVVSLSLALLLLPRLGYLGPAVAAVVSTYGQNAFYVISAGRALSVSPSSLFPWNALARTGAAAILAALPAAPLLLLPLSPIVRLAAGGTLYVLVYALLGRGGVLAREDRDFAWGVVGELAGFAGRKLARRGRAV